MFSRVLKNDGERAMLRTETGYDVSVIRSLLTPEEFLRTYPAGAKIEDFGFTEELDWAPARGSRDVEFSAFGFVLDLRHPLSVRN